MDKIPIGLRVKLKRIERRILQRRLAVLTGIPATTLSDIENSWRLPSAEQLTKIAAAIGVSPEEFGEQP